MKVFRMMSRTLFPDHEDPEGLRGGRKKNLQKNAVSGRFFSDHLMHSTLCDEITGLRSKHEVMDVL